MEQIYPKNSLKRARPVHSCTNCRNKKLKCDRKIPCEKCKRSGIDRHCIYDSHIGSLSRSEHDSKDNAQAQAAAEATSLELSPEALIGGRHTIEHHDRSQAMVPLDLFERLEARVQKLEEAVYARTITELSATKADNQITPQARTLANHTEVAIGCARIRANPHKAIDSFGDAKTFLREKLSSNDICLDLKEMRSHLPKYKVKRKRFMLSRAELGIRILDMLPSREESNQLSLQFFSRNPGIHSMLDRKSYEEEFSQFWSYDWHERSGSRFAPCLLMVAVIATACDPSGSSNLSPQLACDLVEDWVSLLNEPEILEPAVLRLQALLAFSLQIAVAAPPERVWIITGNMMRIAMIANLKDVRMKKQKPFRITVAHQLPWAMMIEMDLQASLIVGLPPAINECDFPGVFSSSDEVENLHQKLEETLPSRIEGARLSGKTTSDQGHPPAVISTLRAMQNTARGLSHAFDKALYDTYLHRSILALSRPLLSGPELQFACVAVAMSSIKILTHFNSLGEQDSSIFFELCRQDVLQALQTTCLMLHAPSYEPLEHSPSSESEGSWSRHKLLRLADATLRRLINNISLQLLGNYCKDLIAFAVIIGGARPADTSTRVSMDLAFSEVVEQLLERANPGRSELPHKVEIPQPQGACFDGDGDLGQSQNEAMNFDFDFEFALDQTYDLDSSIFDFSPESLWEDFKMYD